MDTNEASKKGLAEIAQGVWCCAVKVKALINSVPSRTALACSMLYIFYPKDILTGKRLKDLDPRVVDAIADFAVVARIKERVNKKETENNGNSKEPKNVTRGDVMQAMRQKCNQLIFQTKRPTYHKEKYVEAKKARLELGEHAVNQ
ncbi:uncharacterized protein LOC110050966 [Orbicella faveolata]|uniref:uncharacterized protein LOC110050966 n=1 Tax=Orbicella faveolata TaxID=48498 RepID=UPI0009E554FC|nr:uncharacterized protein LOC110050966 [Orbicella faveolata]